MINHNNFPYNNPQFLANQMRPQGTVFIPVHSDGEVLASPVAPGNTVYFKHETEPYVYTKSMGMSQFEIPQIKKYQLKEIEMNNSAATDNKQANESQPKYLLESDIQPILDELRQCKEELNNLKAKLEEKPTKANTSANTKEK